MYEVKLVTEIQINGKYSASATYTDEVEVYKRLSSALISKKINACRYITRIQRTVRYDGTQQIVVTYCNGVRNIFTVPESF